MRPQSGPRIAVPRWKAPTWERTAYYLDSLTEAGARPRLADEKRLPEWADGLLLMGGVDVNPRLYRERRHRKTEKSNNDRDEQESRLLMDALERDVPVLAICRGHQLLNVAMGGTLVQDLEQTSHRWLDDGESAWHDVRTETGSRLSDVYGGGVSIRVNSRHHQGITEERVGAGLSVTARSHDGLVEGLESGSHRWVVGVQWHPERPEMREDARTLFGAFVEACGG